ncbi:nectin-1-like [Pyxicephalus adspersus]|uniref:nectin-1-like n=1 Tax=Pyxicephalus adspersus TaxID=30357 RepID=UPI003B5A63C2
MTGHLVNSVLADLGDVRTPSISREVFQRKTEIGQLVTVNEEVHTWIGSNVVLNCSIGITGGVTQVTWQRNENGQNVDFLTYSRGKLQKLTKFAESRVEFLGNESTEGSIMIRDVTLADESVYTCIFTTFPLGAYLNKSSLIVQDRPDSVRVEVRLLDNEDLNLICVEVSSLPATNFTWKRKDTMDSDAEEELGHGKTLYIKKYFQNGQYICEVNTPIGKSSGHLHLFQPGSSCLLVQLWLLLFLILFLVFGIFFWYSKHSLTMKEETEFPKEKEVYRTLGDQGCS